MAEVVTQRRRAATVLGDSSALIVILLTCLLQVCRSQVTNRAPHFVPQTGDMSQFTLPEDTPVGTPVYHLKGIDPENSQLRYSISGQYFSVDPLTGVVTLAKTLDREEQANLEVIISITDEGIANTEPNTVSLRRVIPVKDVNDNTPVFHNRPYIVNISEATPVGAEIEVSPRILVTDRDDGDNAKVTISCSTEEKGSDAEACSTFRIETVMVGPNAYEARLFVARALDFEARSAYAVRLVAIDAGRPQRRTLASLAAAVRDVQDQPPEFLRAPYSAAVPEASPPNTSIMEIAAKDGDTANPRPVLLTLEGDSQQYFRLVPERPIGRATLVASDIPIDRESDAVMQNGGVYSFYVKATELINNEVPSDYTVTSVTIVVTDVDDHVPRFERAVYDVSMPENVESGSPVPGLSVYVEDLDAGPNARYELALRDVSNSEGVFALSTDRGEGRTPVGVKVADSSRLDYDVDEELRLFSFDIVASAGGVELSSARVNVKLLDVNDNPPVFAESGYKLEVAEGAALGTLVGEVTASDRDYGIYGELEYSLSGFGAGAFRTDRHSGGVYVAGDLDYEAQKSYSLTLTARDGGGRHSSTSVFVDVLDVNDNAPVFEAAEYSRTIRDGATSFEPQLVVRATDADGPTQGGGRVRYSLEADNSIEHRGGMFAVDPHSGELAILQRLSSMDTPRGQYELIVRATDFGTPPLHNDTQVFIRVGVPGNQRPTFKGNYHHYHYTVGHHPTAAEELSLDLKPMNYQASVREDAPPGLEVATVVANDPDGLDALLTYHIVSGSKDNFIIDEKTGVITVSSDANLDRDSNPERYEIVVSAVDSGQPVPETATTTVFVTVRDVNDKPPSFTAAPSATYISERAKVGDLVTTLGANDTDSTAKLKYSIVEPIKALSKAGIQLKPNGPYDYRHLFRIEEDSGEVFVNATLDYSQASIVILTVRVSDVNAETNKDSQFDETEHTVYVQPYNDQNPQFTNPGWTSTNPVIHHKVREEQPIGSTVLVLMAEDPVSGHLISNFQVLDSQTGLLQVDPQSGQVVLTNHLDYEELTTPNLTMTVQAISNDGNRRSDAKVIIEVVNINDNPPIFEKELYKVSVPESSGGGAVVARVAATDGDAALTDGDQRRGYHLLRYRLSGPDASLFAIDELSGLIQIAQNRSLDRERQSVLRLELEAVDTPGGGAEQRRASALVLVDVLDVDDNAPTFDKELYTAVVPETVPIGYSVINVTATDPDEGLGGEVRYELFDEGEAAGLFAVDPRSGEVSVRGALSGRGRSAAYAVRVRARDGGGHAASARLALYVADVSGNDGVPRFLRPTPADRLHLPENSTIGTVVFQVVATDPDDPTQPSGQLSYSIQEGNADAKAFTIDPSSGVLRTRQPLDRERQAAYTLVVVASDQGAPPQQARRVLAVTVDDVDDHKPRFARALDDPPIVMMIEEEVPIGTVIGKLEAIDEDIGENAAIDYAITEGNELGLVRLKRTNESAALVLVAARIDREAVAKLLLTVKCFKLGTEPPPSGPYNRLIAVVRERDLLRLVLASRSQLPELRKKLADLLETKDLKLQIHDAPHSTFYDNAGPCFQLRRRGSGEALPPRAMLSALRQLGGPLQRVLEAHAVHNITGCGNSNNSPRSPAAAALLALAAALPPAALLAALALCCMHAAAKRRARAGLLSARELQSHASAPSRLYAEPLYST
ncbi:unnamed protein product, partial [Iphiclides podalirius]